MSDIEMVRPARSRRPGSAMSPSGQSGLNAFYATSLMLILFLAPLALGSNRPFFWTLWALLLGLMLGAYGLWVQFRGFRLRVGPGDLLPEIVVYTGLCLFLIAQVLPLGGFGFVPEIVTAAGISLPLQTLSTTPGNTLLMLLRWGTYGALFFLGVQVSLSPKRRLRLLWVIAAIVTAHALIGLLFFYQWGNTILGIEKWAYQDSLTGSFVNRNSFATFLAIGLVVVVGLIANTLSDASQLRGRRYMGVALLLVAALFILAAAFATNSRMGLFSGLVGAAIVVILAMAKSRGLGIGAKVGLAVLTMLLLAAVGYLFGASLWLRFLDVGNAAGVRLELYRQALEMVATRPWTGFGGGSFEQAYQVFHRPPVSTEYIWDRAHNSYLSLWVELGVIAGSLPLLMVAIVFGRAAITYLSQPHLDAASLIGIGAVVVAAIHSAVDFSLEMQAITLLFVMLLAMASAAHIQYRKLKQRELDATRERRS